MAASHSFDINIRHPSGGQSHIIHVRSDMTVEQVKQQFAEKTQIDPNQFKLVFAGTMLNESSTLDTFGLMGYSTLHMIRGRVEVSTTSTKSIRNVEDKLGDLSLGQNGQGNAATNQNPPSHSSRKGYNRFFIYCKDICQEMKPGKLRVRCKVCKDESFELLREPGSWEDVLTANKIEGNCNNPNCQGARFAEFFFKCAGHEDRTAQLSTYTALHMIRANTVDVTCASCGDVEDTVVRFDCNHCMCVDCFVQYCQTNINERRFVEKPDIGYTIECPDKCPDGHVKEIHHFQLMGKDLYERYKNFAAEEFVLQMGGVLCPAAGCGAGILLEDDSRRVQCPTCRHTFCKTCKNDYHYGVCEEARTNRQATAQGGSEFDQGRLQQARWNDESERFIRENEGIKRCPSCHAQIEKNDGCNHMTCRCRHEFCWLCLVPWTPQCQETHWFGPRRRR